MTLPYSTYLPIGNKKIMALWVVALYSIITTTNGLNSRCILIPSTVVWVNFFNRGFTTGLRQ